MPSAVPLLAVELVGQSATAIRLRELVRRAAHLTGGVLLVGEPGTAAAGVAREIHDRSRPASQPWCVMACAHGDAAAGERLLFGTSVAQDADLVTVAPTAFLASARGGTLLLEDVTELAAGLQARLARAIRDGEMLVEGRPTPLDVRFVATAGPSIDEDVRTRGFRHDLYRRLAESRIDLPPLRERPDDIPQLAERLMNDACAAAGLSSPAFTQAARALLTAVDWPGNMSDLRAAVERVAASTEGAVVAIDQLLQAIQLQRRTPPFAPAGTLRDARLRFEREYIGAVLEHHAWQLGDAARTLGIHRPNLYRKARQLGIPITKQSA